MAFSSFGGAPASGPAPGVNPQAATPPASGSSTGGGFSFGGTANAPAGTTPAAAAPSFASTTAAPSTGNAAPASGFSFGGSTPAAPTDPATAAPSSSAPATSSFGFGGNAPSTSTAPPSAPTPASGFSFSSAPSASAPSTSDSSTTTVPPVVTVPEYTTVFPNMKILDKLDELLPKASEDSDDGRLAAQELYHVLDCSSGQDTTKVFGGYLAKPQPLEWKHKDAALREKLKTNPHVSLHGHTAALTPPMLDEVFKLSDELRISEVDALALYAEASLRETRMRLQDRLEFSFVGNALTGSIEPLVLGDDVFRASRELFFYERSCAMRAILKLIQYRLALNTAVLAASDQLIVANLVENLVVLIREWTRRTEALEQELSNASKPAQNMFGLQPSPTDKKEETKFSKVHLKFGYSQRQTAGESLFYLTYHTQCTPNEVGSLIDVIKDLTNGTSETTGLPLLNPFHDVPNAYYDPPAAANNQFPFTQALPPLREKDPVEWEHELVDQVWKSGGKPQLLQCVSTLVLSVVCALDSRHELIDRNTHSVNAFGTGNALFPPQSKDTQQLVPVHNRLNPLGNASKEWKRNDIWGLMVASYALLLRSLPSVASSPRVGSTTTPSSPRPQGPVDVKTTWRACMNAPTGTKAFTSARLCLMPSFERHKDKLNAKCDTYEFVMSVFSDFMSHFLDVLCASGDVPISRSQWERDEEQGLELRREQQEQQHQFRAWAGSSTTGSGEEVIPTSVDLMARPDCLDDVIALAIALCSTGSSYATLFWSTSEEEMDETFRKVLVPSRTLRKLKHQLDSDRSLLPVYVSFLAALALAPAPSDGAESGAVVVNNLLTRAPTESETNRVDWLTLMEAIRWYARELSPGSQSVSKSTAESSSSSPGLAGRASTAYYYGAEDNGMEGSAGYSSSQQAASSTSSSSSSKTREMGETNTNILLSHLGVIATVASESSSARSSLVSMKLPVASQDSTSFAGDDPFLTVLFFLSIAPLTPLVRGAVFSTIASLLKLDDANPDEMKVIQEHAMKGWELLDTFRVLPISLLDQYEALPQRTSQIPQGLAFPPSSISLVSKDTKGAWLPPERIYGIIFELEQIESRTGQYPSTEGFLQLLTSLFIAAGSPASIGKDARPRPGCTPYIEYVANFVLPRALSFKKDSVPLPFRTASDKCRLVSRGLEVIEAVLVRYTVPRPAATSPVPLLVDEKKNQRLATTEASQMFGLSSLVEKIVIAPNEKDAAEYARDYRDTVVSRMTPSGAQDSISSGQAPMTVETIKTEPEFPGGEPPVPRAKSPGFTVLTELLSSSAGPLFCAMVKVLTDDEVARGIRNVCGLGEYRDLVTQALFGQTPPTVSSARAKSTDTSHISPQVLLQPLLPQLEAFAMGRDDAICWRETSIILALRVLCAAAAREEAFYKAVSAGQSLLKIVPVLRFHRRTLPPSGVVVRNVQVSRLVNLLISFGRSAVQGGGYVEPLPAIVQYVQCDASTVEHDAYISSPAVALTYYASQTLGTNESIRALIGSRVDGLSRFAKALGRRLSRSSKLAISRADNDVASLILDSILATFREGCARETSIAHVILGLPFMASEGNWISGTYENAFQQSGTGGVIRDCFDAILERLSDMRFLTSSSSSHLAARCFEIVYRLTEAPPGHNSAAARRISYAANRLRSTHFWTTNLMSLLADHSSGTESLLCQVASIAPDSRPRGIENCLQCIAWLLKSVSSELLALDFSHVGSTSGQRSQLLSLLFSSPYRLLMNVLSSMPISNDRIAYMSPDVTPSREALEAARVPMSGAPEVVAGYTCVDKTKLSQKSVLPSVLEEQMKWADKWNASAAWDCASSHLSVAALILIESAMVSAHPSTSVGMGSTVTSAFELAMPVDMLKVILFRIVDEDAKKSGLLKMDDRISSGVSNSLSRITLLLAEQLASTKAVSDIPNISMESSVVEICRLLVRTVISSSLVDQGRPLLPHEKVRTATFGLALSVMMKSDPDANLLDALMEDFPGAVIALGRLVSSGASASVFGTNEAIDGQRARQLAQLAFSSILGLYRDEENLSVVPLLTAPSDPGVLRTIIESIVSLVAHLDDQIFHVVEKIIECKEGPELVMEARLPQALRHAARQYLSQEQRVKEDLRYSSVSLDVPAFLQGHVLLLKSLLLTPTLTTNRRGQLVEDVLDVLLTYTDVVDRMVGSFPKNGQVLIGILQCFLLASGNGGGLQKFASDERSSIWNRDVLKLSYMLSQNPFPRRYLPTLPMALSEGNRVSVFSNVSISDANANESSWWDIVEQSTLNRNEVDCVFLPGPPSGRAQDFGWSGDPSSLGGTNEDKWTASKYDASLTGAGALDGCLSYLETLSTVHPFLSMDGYALTRGLCRCSDVAKGAHCRLESLERDLSEATESAGADAMDVTWADPVNRREALNLERHYIKKLGALMQRCSEKLLVILSLHLRTLLQAYDNEYDHGRKAGIRLALTEFTKCMSAALDYTKLDTVRFGDTSAIDGTVVLQIGKSLRDELKKAPK